MQLAQYISLEPNLTAVAMTMLAGAANISDRPDLQACQKMEGHAVCHQNRAVQVRV